MGVNTKAIAKSQNLLGEGSTLALPQGSQAPLTPYFSALCAEKGKVLSTFPKVVGFGAAPQKS